MKSIFTVAAMLSLAGGAFAQTPSATVNIADATSAGGLAVIPFATAGLPSGIVAWRAVTDWSVAAGDPFSNESSAFIGDPGTFTLITNTASPIGAAGNGSPVNGLQFAGGFNADPASFTILDLVFGSGNFGNVNFSNTTLELFTAADLPSVPIDPGALSTNAPANITDLGVVGNAGDPVVADTFGSILDTEIGIWTASGVLLAVNDDAGGGLLQSEISLTEGVNVGSDGSLRLSSFGAGTYILGVGEFDTVFGEDFAFASPPGSGGAGGSFVGNVNGVPFSGDLSAGPDAQFFSFTIVPAPGAATLLGLAGVAGMRRRRN